MGGLHLTSRDVYFKDFCREISLGLGMLGQQVSVSDGLTPACDTLVAVGTHLFLNLPYRPDTIVAGIQTEQQPMMAGSSDRRLQRNLSRSRAVADYYDILFDWIPGIAETDRRVFLPYGCYQTAFDPALHKNFDVCFIGNIHGNRRESLLNRLTPDYHFFPTFSPGFGETKSTAIRQSRILLNIKFYEHGGFESPRMFDYLSAGAFVLSEHTAVTTPFVAGRDFIEFSGEQQLRELLSYYLANDAARERIARQGHATSQQYTFRHVAQLLLNELSKVQRRRPTQRIWGWTRSRVKCAWFEARDQFSLLRRRLTSR
jgi:hypothetical protein